jgi:hypothetical protein
VSIFFRALMALRALNWLSENLGIDITGENKDDDPGGVIGQISKTVFGDAKEEEAGIQQEAWGYQYNSVTQQWEPTTNAPEHIIQEQQERLHELHAPPKEIPPPPVLSSSDFNWTRDLKAPKYADHFNSYSNGQQRPPSGPPSPVLSVPAPAFQPQFIRGELPPGDMPAIPVQEEAPAVLHFTPSPFPPLHALEGHTVGPVQGAAPLPVMPQIPPSSPVR